MSGEIDDGFGNIWALCKPGCQLQVVRPGKVQCECEERASLFAGRMAAFSSSEEA